MKGRLTKRELGWVIEYQEVDPLYPLIPTNKLDKKEILLHPYDDVNLIEGREVDFEIDHFWEHGLEQVYKVAKLTTPKTTSDKWKEYQDWLNELPEISDEEIEKAAEEKYPYNELRDGDFKGMLISAKKNAWVDAIKWYSEKLKTK
jgi:hypothetical protein